MPEPKSIYTRQDDIAAHELRSRQAALASDEPSMTHQAPAWDCDINNIAKAYGLTAGSKMPVPAEALDPSFYGDLSQAPDSLQSALELVRDAELKFARLPADLRAMFHHSPGVMWDWLNQAENVDKAVELGLLRRQDDSGSTNSSGGGTGVPPNSPTSPTGS